MAPLSSTTRRRDSRAALKPRGSGRRSASNAGLRTLLEQRWAFASLCCAGVIAAIGGTASPARAAGAGKTNGCLTVHVGPAVTAGAPASYFSLTLPAGATDQQAVLLANPQAYACRVFLTAAYGKTAANSGDTYPPAPTSGCIRTSCWIHGLPTAITVPAHSRLNVPFGIVVPAGTLSGDYLAGVLVRPALAPRAQPALRRRHGIGAVVTTSVGIGVAVRVPGPLHRRLTIASVSLDSSGATPLLVVVEHNAGNAWEHPAGGAVFRNTSGAASRFGMRSRTVLPGDSAALTLPVNGLRAGSHPTTVTLWYDNRTKRAVWRGTLDIPFSTTPGSHPAPHQVVIVTSRTPGWIIVLAAGLTGAVALLLTALLVVMLRRLHGTTLSVPTRSAPPDERSDGTTRPPD